GPWVSINAEMTGDGDACLIVDNPGPPSPPRHRRLVRAVPRTGSGRPVSDHGRSSSGRSTGYPLHRSSHRDRGPSACGRARTELSVDASRAAGLERPDYAACSIIAGTLVLRVADVADRLYWLEWQVLRGFPGGWSWRIGAISASCNGPSPVVGARLSYSLFIVLSYGFSAGPRDP